MGKTVKISGNEIKRIIKDAINDKVSVTIPNTMLNEVATMDRINLNEMILNTVPARKVVAYLISGFNFATYYDFDENRNYGIVEWARENIIQLWIREKDEEAVIEIMGKLGWICGARNLYQFLKNEIGELGEECGLIGLQFEKRFDDDVTAAVFKERYIYHFAPTILLNKIMKQGLVPKSNTWAMFGGDKGADKNAEYRNTSDAVSHARIFFFFHNEAKGVDKEDYFKRKFNGKETEMSLLRVDVNKIPRDVKFYEDPKQWNAVYTYSNIPPEAIEVVG